ncbi:MAG: Bax inhibitor-1 family protein [Cyanobacteria bacterium P01_G01_bin.38]
MIAVAQARPSERAEFIKRTYLHLAGAVGAFIVVEFLFFQLGIADLLFNFVSSSGRLGWFAILGGVTLLGYLSSSIVAKANDINKQYLGLGIYVVGQAIIFAPLLYMAANFFPNENVISTAAIITLFMFAGLTAVVFTTGKDFSFLSGILKIGGMVAMGLIVASLIFGFSLGIFFSFVMVAFASAAILFETSKIMKRYSTHHYVAASLQLFSSVMLLFWYVLRIVMSSRR